MLNIKTLDPYDLNAIEQNQAQLDSVVGGSSASGESISTMMRNQGQNYRKQANNLGKMGIS
jgi:hypothetical protein